MITIDAPPGILCYEREPQQEICEDVNQKLRPSIGDAVLFVNKTECRLRVTFSDRRRSESLEIEIVPKGAFTTDPRHTFYFVSVILIDPACNQRPMS